MNTWLKVIGFGNKPVTEAPYHGKYDLDYVGFHRKDRPSIRTGDHLFLYAAGGSKRIFAEAVAIDDPRPNDSTDRDSPNWKLKVSYVTNLRVSFGVHIDEISTARRNLTKSVMRASHIKLDSDEAERASVKLNNLKSATQLTEHYPKRLIES